MAAAGPERRSLTIRQAVFPADAEDLARLCWAYRELLIARMPERPEIVERYYAAEDYARLIADLPRIHARPRGDILLAEAGGAVVGWDSGQRSRSTTSTRGFARASGSSAAISPDQNRFGR